MRGHRTDGTLDHFPAPPRPADVPSGDHWPMVGSGGMSTPGRPQWTARWCLYLDRPRYCSVLFQIPLVI